MCLFRVLEIVRASSIPVKPITTHSKRYDKTTFYTVKDECILSKTEGIIKCQREDHDTENVCLFGGV